MLQSVTQSTPDVALRCREGVPAGTTYGDFLVAMAQLGMTLDTPLGSIEFGILTYGSGRIGREDDEFGGADIREIR